MGFSQMIRFILGRLRGANVVELRVRGIRTPLLCRTSGADRWTLWHVFGREHFDISPDYSPRLIVDGGANVGYASISFATKYPGARVIAIEPNAENCTLFRKNCAAYPNIELVQGALWSSSTDLVIENPDARSHAFRVVEIPSPTDQSFKGFTVGDILARSGRPHVDLLKLDVEGSEEQLFSSNYEAWIDHVQRMMVETHGKKRRRVVNVTAKKCGFSVSKSGEYTVLEKQTPRRGSEHEERVMKENQLLERSIEHLHGPEEIAYEKDELVVVCIVRDGRHYVEPFVDHYFSLGVKHIVFLDNDSEDGTVEALENHDNVTVLRTKLPYKAPGSSVGNGWTREVLFKQYLISRFGGENRWCLCADIDELFDYPYSDVVGLDSMLRYLTGKSYTAVAAQMLDMFSDAPLSGHAGDRDEPFKDAYRFYDVSKITRRSAKGSPRHRSNEFDGDAVEVFFGGIRESIFGHRAVLTKFPLVFNDGETRPLDGSSHRVTNARIADFTGVLLHYKLLDEHFHAQVEQAVREEHRLQNSAVYKIYKDTLDREPALMVKRDTAREMKSTNDLVEDRVLTVSEDYVNWVDVEEEKSLLQDAPQGEGRELAETLLDSRRRERLMTLKSQKLEQQLLNSRMRLRRENRILKQQLQGVRSFQELAAPERYKPDRQKGFGYPQSVAAPCLSGHPAPGLLYL